MSNKSKVEELLHDINVNLSQRSASQKDEVRVMQEMLNDRTYWVGEYDKRGKIGNYCPSDSARKIVASVIANGCKVPVSEAKAIAENYEFTRPESSEMINIAKEFVNTYIQTGRKLPLGGREDMNVSLSLKEVGVQNKKLPNGNGDGVIIPAHKTVKAQGGCPKWVREGK